MDRVVLETERLWLREMAQEDLDAFSEILGDPETMRFYPHPYSREETSEAIERALRSYREDGFGKWALVLKDTGEFVGYCGLTLQDVDGEKLVEVGYVVKKTHWRRGLASEAALACRDYTFDVVGVDRLIALVRLENEPSAGVARKLGMTVWKHTSRGGLRHHVFSMGSEDRP
jgi:RimJ/RimL family protein N-acetyltransferase